MSSIDVRLGVSRSLLDWVFDFHLKIEEKYTGKCYKLSRSIQEQLDALIALDAWMDGELSDFTTSINGHEKQMEALMDRLVRIRELLDIPRLGQGTRNRWQDNLATVEQDIEKLKMNGHSEDELDYVSQLTEVKRITNENIKHLRILHAKHEGESKRVIVDVLKQNTVDIQVYFAGVINGAHCFNFAEHCEAIIAGITTEMLKLVHDDEELCTAVCKFDVQMKRVLKPWYRLMCVMTSIKRHSADTIASFRADLAEMKEAMLDVVESPALEGEDNPLKLPTTIKAHILFGKHTDDATISHALQQLIDFEATGSLDEQNGERTHAEVNQLIREFGNLRGKFAKRMWLREFHWRGHSEIQGMITEMKEETKRKGGASRAVAPQIQLDEHRETSETTQRPEDFATASLDESAGLTEEEVEINNNESLRGPTNSNHKDFDALSDKSKQLLTDMDTKIVVCPHCSMRCVGRGTFNIHAHESHQIFCAELDGNEQTMVATVR